MAATYPTGAILSMERSRAMPEDTYHHGNLKAAVRTAALEIIAADGPAALSLREVARRAGVSHTAPKHHFGDKRQMLTTFAVEGFELLADAMVGASANATDPKQRVISQIGAYVRLHDEHPGHAALMWRDDVVDRTDPSLQQAALATFTALYASVSQLERATTPTATFELTVMLWSLAHGVSQLSPRITPALAVGVGADARSVSAGHDHLVETLAELALGG